MFDSQNLEESRCNFLSTNSFWMVGNENSRLIHRLHCICALLASKISSSFLEVSVGRPFLADKLCSGERDSCKTDRSILFSLFHLHCCHHGVEIAVGTTKSMLLENILLHSVARNIWNNLANVRKLCASCACGERDLCL